MFDSFVLYKTHKNPKCFLDQNFMKKGSLYKQAAF